MTKILLSVAGAQEPDLQRAGTHSTKFSSSQLQPQVKSRATSFLQRAAALAQLETKASLVLFTYYPQAPQGWGSSTSKSQDIVAQAQGTAQALAAPVPNSSAGSLLHSTYFIRFRAGQITVYKMETTLPEAGLWVCSSIPMAQKHLVEAWRG